MKYFSLVEPASRHTRYIHIRTKAGFSRGKCLNILQYTSFFLGRYRYNNTQSADWLEQRCIYAGSNQIYTQKALSAHSTARLYTYSFPRFLLAYYIEHQFQLSDSPLGLVICGIIDIAPARALSKEVSSFSGPKEGSDEFWFIFFSRGKKKDQIDIPEAALPGLKRRHHRAHFSFFLFFFLPQSPTVRNCDIAIFSVLERLPARDPETSVIPTIQLVFD